MSEMTAQYQTLGAAGPVSRAWVHDLTPISMIVGPPASGKTTAGVSKGFNIARLQHASPIDGVRRAKITVVRTTYGRLWENFIPSYLEAVPKAAGKWNGATGGPADHRLRFLDPQYGKIDLWFSFRAIGELSIADFASGNECTYFWLNEPNYLPSNCLYWFWERAGRYPPIKHKDPDLPPAPYGIMGDMNRPADDNWLWKRLDGEQFPDTDRLWRQPHAFHPEAENVENLRRINPNYYENMARGMEEWMVQRRLYLKGGYDRTSAPVYPVFDQERHVADFDLTADPRSEIIVGVDGGYTPAAAIVQKTYGGAVKGLAEFGVARDEKMSAEEFGEKLRELLLRDFAEHAKAGRVRVFVDPAADMGGEIDGFSWLSHFQKALQVARVRPASTNDIVRRRKALNILIKGNASYGNTPRLSLAPSMKTIVAGLAGQFKFKKSKEGDDREDHQRPVLKNHYSHYVEALEYAVLSIVGHQSDKDVAAASLASRANMGSRNGSGETLVTSGV